MKKESPPEGEPPTSRLGIRWRVAATDPRLPEAAPAIVFPPSPFSREKADGGARRKWPDYSTLRVWASAPLRDEQQFDSVGMQNREDAAEAQLSYKMSNLWETAARHPLRATTTSPSLSPSRLASRQPLD